MPANVQLMEDVASRAAGTPESISSTLFALSGADRAPTAFEMTQQTRAQRANSDIVRRINQRRIVEHFQATDSDRREQLNADQDVQAIVRGFNTGVLNKQQADQAMEQVRKEYGDARLLRSPQAQQWFGIERDVQAQQQEAIQQMAEQTGLPSRFFRWNPDEGRVTADSNMIQLEYVKQNLENFETQRFEQGTQVIRDQYKIAAGLHDAQLKNKGRVEPGVKQELNRLRTELFQRLEQSRGLFGAERTPAAPAAPAAPPSFDEAVENVPAAPVPPPTYKRFDSIDAHRAAVRAGRVGVGEISTIRGVRVKVTPDGKVTRVQ